MGPTSGPRGIRAYNEKHIVEAILRVDNPGDIVKNTNCAKKRAAAVIDGNIILNGVSAEIRTFAEYLAYFKSLVLRYAQSFQHVVVVFDESAHVPLMKKREQDGRDEAKMIAHKKAGTAPGFKAFEGAVGAWISGDDYHLKTLEGAVDCHKIVSHRPCRDRFVDELGVQLIASISEEAGGSEVVVDGIDPRGASRPFGEERNPVFVAKPKASGVPITNYGATPPLTAEEEKFEALCCTGAMQRPIGEGDHKMRAVDECLRRSGSFPQPLEGGEQGGEEGGEEGGDDPLPALMIWVTTDLDSISIGLFQVAVGLSKRMEMLLSSSSSSSPSTPRTVLHMLDNEPHDAVTTVIATREQMQTRLKRAREEARASDVVITNSKKPLELPYVPVYQCFSVPHIFRHFAARMCPNQTTSDAPILAAAGIVGAINLGGCDYVEKNHACLRTDLLLRALCNECGYEGGSVEWLRPLLEDAEDVDSDGRDGTFKAEVEREQKVMLRSAEVLARIVRESGALLTNEGGRNSAAQSCELAAMASPRTGYAKPIRQAAWCVRYWASKKSVPLFDDRKLFVWGNGAPDQE